VEIGQKLLAGRGPMSTAADPGGFPQRRAARVPAVTAAQMREIERTALEEYGLDILQVMENVGRSVAALAMAMLGGRARGQRIIVLAGGGNKGGGGLCAVRHLANAGFVVEPVMGAVEEELSPPSRRQLHILRQSGIAEPRDLETSAMTLEQHMARADLVIDALVGYGLVGPPGGIASAIVELANASRRTTLALDIPTGLNATTGEPSPTVITASTTLALGLPKRGVLEPGARDYVGKLFLADIGIPEIVEERAGIRASDLFSEGPIVRLRR
jgi:NAD(P)H-hydrate epimerase